MARQKVTLEDKRMVRDFLAGLAATYPTGWDGLMDDAGVPRNTGQGWRYRTPRGTPSAPHLLRILDAAGVLRASAARKLDEALRAANEAAAGPQAGQTPQAGRARGASKR